VLIVKATGYFGKKISVEIPGDSTLTLNVALVLPSHLVVVSEPAGASAFLDDKELGVTPCDNPVSSRANILLRWTKPALYRRKSA